MKSRFYVARVGSRGRITIPKRLRDAMGLKAGDLVRFEVRQGEIILETVKPSLRDFEGSVEPRKRPENFDDTRLEVKRRRADKNVSD